MASTASASSTPLHDKEWLSRIWKEALCRRTDCVDVFDGTKLKQMADELGFWAFRVDTVFPEETHTRLVNLTDTAFHLDSGVSEVMHRTTPR
jgi:hypothetical protein